MSDGGLRNLMALEVVRGRRTSALCGIVDGYDPDRHAVKVKLLTDLDGSGSPRISGWIPIKTGAASSGGASIVMGPSIGDQVMIDHLEDDPESPVATGFMHNDKDRPPRAESGEVVIKTASGATVKIDKSGAVTITTGGAMTLSGQTITITGNVAISGGTLTHNGHDVGSTHMHQNVTAGTALTGPPA